jgi:uncharacterized protein
MKFPLAIRFLWVLCFLLQNAFAQIPAKPNPPKLVNDYVQLLTKAEQDQLEKVLVAYNDSTSTQITIVIVKNYGDQNAGDFATDILEKWGVGDAKKDNGVVIVMNTEPPRDVFIGTGYGIEPVLTDALCKRTIEEVIIPKFKEGKYFDGLYAGVDQIKKIVKGEFKGTGPKKQKKPFNWMTLIFIAVILIALFSRGGKGGGRGYSRTFGGPFFGGIPRGGSSWGGGGFGGGGFGGFGGGSGGGGGAGGRW